MWCKAFASVHLWPAEPLSQRTARLRNGQLKIAAVFLSITQHNKVKYAQKTGGCRNGLGLSNFRSSRLPAGLISRRPSAPMSGVRNSTAHWLASPPCSAVRTPARQRPRLSSKTPALAARPRSIRGTCLSALSVTIMYGPPVTGHNVLLVHGMYF